MKFIAGYLLGALIVAIYAFYFWTDTPTFTLGEEVQKIIKVCEETLPRNEKCTFLIVPESKLLIEE